MRKKFWGAVFCVAMIQVCAPSVAGSEQGMAAIDLLGRIDRETDFLRLSRELTFVSSVYNALGPISVIVRETSSEGSALSFTCGVMRSADGKAVHVSGLDAVTMSRPSDPQGLSLSVTAVPSKPAVLGGMQVPEHVLTQLSDGKTGYYELTNAQSIESPEALACPGISLPAEGKSCKQIEPYLVGGTAIRLLARVQEVCQRLLGRHNFSKVPLTLIDSDAAGQAIRNQADDGMRFRILWTSAPKPVVTGVGNN